MDDLIRIREEEHLEEALGKVLQLFFGPSLVSRAVLHWEVVHRIIALHSGCRDHHRSVQKIGESRDMADFSFSGWEALLSAECVKGVCEMSVSLVVDPSIVSMQEDMEKIAQTSGVKLSILRGAMGEMVMNYDLARRNGWAPPKLSSHLSLNQCPESVVTIAAQVYGDNQGRITAASLSKTLKANQLVDMDWVFGVTASSDSCDEIGKTFLQLKLTFEQEVSGGGKSMHLEMSVEQFFAFLSSMEQCKQILDVHATA